MSEQFNKCILDSTAQINSMVTGASPAVAMGSMFMSGALSMGMSFQSTALAQQNNFMTGSASAVKGVNKLYETNWQKDFAFFAKKTMGE